MNVSLLALVVVYGIDPVDTPSLLSLLSCSREHCTLRIIIWDNSPQRHEFDWTASDLDVRYVSTPENLGLSVIYNRVSVNDLRSDEYLFLLDQDSDLPNDHLSKVAAAIKSHPDIDLFLPMILANGRWASPVTYYCGWGRQWKAAGAGSMPSKRVCAINSGMIISSAYLREHFPAYDERLRFYGTDTQFMLDYNDRRRRLCIIDTVINHDLSFFSGASATRVQKFAAMKAAYDFIYEKRPKIQQIAVGIVMLIVSIRYAIKYHDLAFLRSERP